MAAVTPSALRQRVAARVTAIGSTWWEAPVAPTQFGASAVPDAIPATKAHLAFAVDMPTTDDAEETRQKASYGANVTTDVKVRFLARHTPGPTNSLASQDAALDAEHALVKQLCAQSSAWPVDLRILYRRTDRTINDTGEWFEYAVHFSITSLLALQ